MTATGPIDTAVFGRLESFRQELTGYCYRMLASPQDAEDAVQDTLVRAWRSLGRFEDRVGMRPWLYRIATNVCLDMLKGRGRRALPMDLAPVAGYRSYDGGHDLSLGAPRAEATWVQPIPDSLISSPDNDPAEMTVSRESIRLAFIAALQHLVPRQRAVLILRDVLGWRANEVADLLDTSTDAVNSTLRRARSALVDAKPDVVPTESTTERRLLERYIQAFERYDVAALVALLRDDAILTMPPFELWLQGRGHIRRFLAAMEEGSGQDHVVPLAVNRCPGLAVYRPAGPSGALTAFAIQVLEPVGGRIGSIHAFLEPQLFAVFGLPPVPESVGG